MKLKQGCSIYSDYGLNISAEEYAEHGVPIIRTSDVNNSGALDLANTKYVEAHVVGAKRLRIGDVLFSRSGTIGRAMVFDADVEATYAAYLVRFRPHPKRLLSNYIGYWAQSAGYWHQIGADTIQSTIGNFNANKFANLSIPEHDLATQRQIADFLDRETARIDLLIEKREKFANLVSEARGSLVTKMICGEGSEKLDTTRHVWTEARPKHWKSERAKIHFRERIEKSVDGTEELLTVSHITGVTTRAEKDVNMFLAESNEGYKIVHPGDLVINTMWGWMGAMGVSAHHGIISPSYGVYRPTSAAFEPDYLDLMLRSKPFVAEVTRRSKGIHSSRLRIYPDAFLDMRLPIPPHDEQVAILAELRQRTERENALLSKNEQASALLKEYRSALITAAVTGKIDLATYAKSGTRDRRLDAIQEEMGA